MKKQSKNSPSAKDSNKGNKLVLSSVCESCTEQCELGKRYILSLKNNMSGGKGVKCNKL